jgi:hypothetical protein
MRRSAGWRAVCSALVSPTRMPGAFVHACALSGAPSMLTTGGTQRPPLLTRDG